jgi:hypothetical protein
MSKGVKKVLGVAAMVAMPFAAPAILGAIAGSAAISGIAGGAVSAFLGTTAGTTLGSAAIGAGVGALTGGKKGALAGAIGGGLGGFSAGLNTASAAGTAGTAGATGAGGGVGGGIGNAIGTAASTAQSAAAPASIGSRILSVAGSVGKSLGLTDPGMLGRAAMYLASGAIAKGTRPDDPLFQQYVNRLRQLEGMDNQLYQQTMQVAQQNLAEAAAIDPTGEGMRAANQAKIQTLAAGEQALENVPANQVGLRTTGTRQYYTDAARNAAAAFTQGSETARSRKAQTRNAAFAGVQVPTNRWGTAAEGERARSAEEGQRSAGILDAFKYITTPQVPAGGGTGGGGDTGGGGGLWDSFNNLFKTTPRPEEVTA